MTNDIDRAGVARAYAAWAPVYDMVFGKVFDEGRKSTIAVADAIGGRVLDVGVGTGLRSVRAQSSVRSSAPAPSPWSAASPC